MTGGAGWGRTLALASIRRRRFVLVAAVIVGAGSAWLAAGLRPAASIESLLSRDDPAARALAEVTSRFHLSDELVLLVSSSSETATAARADVLAFAERLERAIAGSERASAMCRGVRYKPSVQFRRFVAEVMAPAALFYLDSDGVDLLFERLSPASMRTALSRLERALSVPGAGGAVTQQLARDPLALRELLRREGGSGKPIFGADSGAFLSGSGRHLLIRIEGARPSSDLDFSGRFVREVSALAGDVRGDRVEFEVTGAYAIADEAQRSIRSDMIRSIVCSVLLLQALFLLFYRDVWTLPIVLVPVIVGILFGFATFRLLGLPLSPITAVTGAMLAGLSVDYAIHSLAHVRSARARGFALEPALADAGAVLSPALLAACLTTLIGFAAIALARVGALQEFALLGALGLGASFAATVVVLPPLLVGVSRWGVPGGLGAAERAVRWPGRLVGVALRRPRVSVVATLSIAGVCAVVVAVFGTPARLFESDLTVMHPRPNRPLDVQQRVAELFGISPDPFLVLVRADSEAALVQAAHDVRKAVASLDGDGVVSETSGASDSRGARETRSVGTFGLADFLPEPSIAETRRRLAKSVDGASVRAAFESALAETKLAPAAFADYAEFLQRLFSIDAPPTLAELLPYPEVAGSVLPKLSDDAPSQGDARAGGSGRFESLVFIRYEGPLRDRADRDALIAELRTALAPISAATLTGLPVVGHDTERAIRVDLRLLLSAAGGLVVVWLLVVFRRVRPVLLTLIPVGFGLLLLAAAMLILGVRLNMINLIALPLVVGVGVDDGIFLVSSVLASQRDAAGGRVAWAAQLGASFEAVCLTSLTTVLTFGTLALTSTPAIQSLGVVMAIGVLADLFATVLLLVPLLAFGLRERGGPGESIAAHGG